MRKIITIMAFTAILFGTYPAIAAEETPLTAAEEIKAKMKNGEWLELAKIYDAGLNESEELTAETLASWWDIFNDPIMTELILRALENNRDLASARASVTEARYQLGISQADLLPWFDAAGSWTNYRAPVETTGTGSAKQYLGLSIDATWEIDLFGGKRATVKAQKATLEGQYAAMYSTWQSLAAETAMDYISLRTLQQQLDIANENVRLQQETYDIQKSKVEAGLADELTMKQAEYTLEQTRSSIPTIKASIENTMNALAILVGDIPGSLQEELLEHKPIPQLDSLSLVGIPANAIRQRPDIREAERNFIAQMARKKAARADLWPKFYLTGAIGTEAHEGSLFSGSNKMYSFLPQISWPIFHAGSITRNIKAQGAKAEQLLAVYEQTVLQAIGEVRDAISDTAYEYIKRNTLESGVKAALEALELAQEKYSNGLVDFTNVINAQTALVSLSNDFVISQGQISTDAVRLFKALGGGWKPLQEAEYALAEAQKK